MRAVEPDFARLMAGPGAPEPFDVAALLARPAWHADAACREHPELSWFAERGQSGTAAKQVCEGCLVRDECRAYALADSTLSGVWGAMSEPERREARKVRSGGWRGHTAA